MGNPLSKKLRRLYGPGEYKVFVINTEPDRPPVEENVRLRVEGDDFTATYKLHEVFGPQEQCEQFLAAVQVGEIPPAHTLKVD